MNSPTLWPQHWTDAYLLGYGPMDETHREFVECVARLQTCAESGVLDALLAFKTHVETHFAEEWQWMEATEFPPRQCRLDEHEKVLKSVRDVVALLRHQISPENVAIVRSFSAELADWFPGHTDYHDSALSHWMCKRQFGGKPIVLRRGMATGTSRPPK